MFWVRWTPQHSGCWWQCTATIRESKNCTFCHSWEGGKELECLQALRVIRPVWFSDWATPIVPVMKGWGRLRICGDYKVTMNQAAKLEKYPIPWIEELFASLAGWKAFSKLDLLPQNIYRFLWTKHHNNNSWSKLTRGSWNFPSELHWHYQFCRAWWKTCSHVSLFIYM